MPHRLWNRAGATADLVHLFVVLHTLLPIKSYTVKVVFSEVSVDFEVYVAGRQMVFSRFPGFGFCAIVSVLFVASAPILSVCS